ncbi:hypothetical protein D3C77_316420 [compost metagenome]
MRDVLEFLLAFANGQGTCGVGLAALGGGAQHLATDHGRAQLQGSFIRLAPFQCDAVTVDIGCAQAGAGQQAGQRLTLWITAAEARGTQTLGHLGANQHLHPGHRTEGRQRPVQRLRRNLELISLGLHGGCGEDRHGQRAAAQGNGQAQHSRQAPGGGGVIHQ